MKNSVYFLHIWNLSLFRQQNSNLIRKETK